MDALPINFYSQANDFFPKFVLYMYFDHLVTNKNCIVNSSWKNIHYLEPNVRKICYILIYILIFVAEKCDRVTIKEFHT